MMITNEKKFKSVEHMRRLLILLSAVAIAVLAYWNTSLSPVLFYLTIGIILFTLLMVAWHFLKGLAFFSFEEVGDILIFRYYSTGNFNFARMQISISHTDFAGFKLENKIFNLRKNLILYEKINNRKASYSPLNISSLSLSQQKELVDKLHKLSK